MGTYSSIFIEFKKKDQWHLLEGIVPSIIKNGDILAKAPLPTIITP